MTDLRDQLADTTPLGKLSQTAIELIARIRDEDPDSNAAWLTRVLPDPADWFRLAFVLAAAVPDDRTWRQLTAWTRQLPPARSTGGLNPETAPTPRPSRRRTAPLKPCGTLAAVKRHRSRREPLCDVCREAERAYERDRREARRALTPDRRTA